MKILVVEDEPSYRNGLVELFEGEGHEVEAVGEGPGAVELAVSRPFDLVVLDRMLPGFDGVEVCRRTRQARPDLPVLMLTAKGDVEDRVEGLRAGADDYLAKPFSVEELLARVDALKRRSAAVPSEPEAFELDGATVDLGLCVVRRDGEEIPLTTREVGIVRWLRRHRTRAVSRAELLERVWGTASDIETRTVDMAVVGLRRKIEVDPRSPRWVVSVKGVGYRWGSA